MVSSVFHRQTLAILTIWTGKILAIRIDIRCTVIYTAICLFRFDFSSAISEVSDSVHMTSQILHNETATNLTIYDVNPEDIYDLQDSISQVKAAFIYHLKKNTTKCTSIINQLFTSTPSFTTEFDNIIIKIAKDLAEDIPAADPRWEEQLSTSKCALGSSTSLQIIQQLKEKSRAFTHFIDFLQATQLWDKVSMN